MLGRGASTLLLLCPFLLVRADTIPSAPELGNVTVVETTAWSMGTFSSSKKFRETGFLMEPVTGNCSNALCGAKLNVPPGAWPAGVNDIPRIYAVEASETMLSAVPPQPRTPSVLYAVVQVFPVW